MIGAGTHSQPVGKQKGEGDKCPRRAWVGEWGRSRWWCDENQQAPLKDPLHVPVRPITRARSKKIKEALNGLIQEIWAGSNTGHSKLGPKEDEA